VFHIAENTGVLKYKLWEEAYPVEIYAPTEVKKFATGKGNADKKSMYLSFRKETGIDINQLVSSDKNTISSPVTDIVDAYFICKLLHNNWVGRYA
jgi:Holliday junction resolvasome RuvABC endonuclease subunit